MKTIKLTVAGTSSNSNSKILIIIWNIKFHHWQQISSVVFLEVIGSLLIFEQMSLKYPDLNNHIVYQLLFQVKMVLWKKAASSTCNTKHGIRACQDSHYTSKCNRSESLMHTFCSLHRIVKRHELKGEALIKLIFFTLLSSTFLNKIAPPLYCEHMKVKNVITTSTVLCHYLKLC